MTNSVLRITIQELCQQEGLAQATMIELVEHDIAQPVAGQSPVDWVFDTTGSHWIKKAIRLQRDLELDWLAVAMLVDLLRQQERLQRENQSLKRRLDRLLSDDS